MGVKNMKSPHGEVLFLVKFTKSNTPTWVFFTLFKLYKWYQIAQSIFILRKLLSRVLSFSRLFNVQFFLMRIKPINNKEKVNSHLQIRRFSRE